MSRGSLCSACWGPCRVSWEQGPRRTVALMQVLQSLPGALSPRGVTTREHSCSYPSAYSRSSTQVSAPQIHTCRSPRRPPISGLPFGPEDRATVKAGVSLWLLCHYKDRDHYSGWGVPSSPSAEPDTEPGLSAHVGVWADATGPRAKPDVKQGTCAQEVAGARGAVYAPQQPQGLRGTPPPLATRRLAPQVSWVRPRPPPRGESPHPAPHCPRVLRSPGRSAARPAVGGCGVSAPCVSGVRAMGPVSRLVGSCVSHRGNLNDVKGQLDRRY